jgi:hypothetical protein
MLVQAYIQVHCGFLLKEMITTQAETVERLHWAIEAGGLFWDPTNARYVKALKRNGEEFIRKPNIVGITRELEFERLGSWIGSLFDYHPPRFGFNPSQQRLLLSALVGETGTDQELCEKLRISLTTVKKMWLSIYDRVAEGMPEWIPDHARADTGPPERGKEKRRRLLAYLREHPEELRPVSRKHLQQRSAPRKPLRIEPPSDARS